MENGEAEPVACWKQGCYLAVDDEGRCPEHGMEAVDGNDGGEGL